jgi:phage terminase Nu1 subunit (DNA packaging protein)
MKMSGKQINVNQAAELFGINRTTLYTWLKQGCPYEVKADRKLGQEWVLNSAEVAQWRTQQAIKNAIGNTNDVDSEELKRRKLAAETAIAEIEAAKARGEVLELEAVAKVITDDYITIKQRLRQIPQRIAPLIVGEIDEALIKNMMIEEIDDVLTELSNGYYEES